MGTIQSDPFAQLKAAQRESWAVFAPVEMYTTVPAARLVRFAQVARGQRVLDVGCGTGVVAITAGRLGASVTGIDLSPALIERARTNASIADLEIDFREGDVEALPFSDASFDVVLSQFGHIFAPRPAVAVDEMLRVLRPGGRIAFSTWPPDHYAGRQLALLARYMPPPPAASELPASPILWGEPSVIAERLGERVYELLFERDTLVAPTLSPQHWRALQEATIGPLARLISTLQNDSVKLAALRTELEKLIEDIFDDNRVRQHYLMARATKLERKISS